MTEHALIMCREPGRLSTLDKGHEEGGSAYANAGSKGNTTQYYVMAYMGKESKRVGICIPDSFCCAPEANKTL